MLTNFLGIIALHGLLGAAPPAMCEIEGGLGGEHATAGFVHDATLIVRARAIGTDSSATKHGGRIAFEVVEVLKAAAGTTPRRLVIDGTLSDRDDFNDQSVPYGMVRPTGRAGTCYARQYRVGAEYLLLLNEEAPGMFTPYWAPLLPTNEQLHGQNDAWLAWVRAQM